MKGGEKILKAFELDPKNTLKMISEEQLPFCVISESCHIIKYNIFLQTYFYDCPTHVSSCEHILGVQLIINMNLLSRTHKDDRFEIFSLIEGTCVATTNLDVTNEEYM